jgi:hypothetical protein
MQLSELPSRHAYRRLPRTRLSTEKVANSARFVRLLAEHEGVLAVMPEDGHADHAPYPTEHMGVAEGEARPLHVISGQSW